jgi:succinylglutamate desuccinylase
MLLKNKFLIIAATHGDETIGLKIIEYLKGFPLKDKFDSLIGNPEALKRKRRFIDVDLNRAYPGKNKSLSYEETRAREILKIAKRYKYIIDIHQTISSSENIIIVPHKKIVDENIKRIRINKIILWPSTSGRKTGSLAQFLPNCLEVEIGTKGRKTKEIVSSISKLIIDFINSFEKKEMSSGNKKIYLVYGKLMKNEYQGKQLKDFKKIRIKSETFVPLLVNQYLKNGILCYKMRPVYCGKKY